LALELESRLPAPLPRILRLAREAARRERTPLYLVGGAARDLLLARPVLDLDLVAEGDALALARAVAEAAPAARLLVHPRFGTAVVRTAGLRVDFATAREETYERPGALPTVRPGTIATDLYRRDFTINALAISLGPNAFGDLVDPHGGVADLNAGLLRVLHHRSFIDDATRILRGARYAGRLRFRWEDETGRLARRDAPMLEAISGERLLGELERMLREEDTFAVLYEAEQVGALPCLNPALRADAWLREAFQRAEALRRGAGVTVKFCLLLFRASPQEVQSFVARFRPPREWSRALDQIGALRGLLSALGGGLPPSAATDLLEPFAVPVLLAGAAADTGAEAVLMQFLRRWRFVRPRLDGEALKSLGFTPGPALGAALRALRAARLDGKARTEAEERALARTLLAARGGPLEEG